MTPAERKEFLFVERDVSGIVCKLAGKARFEPAISVPNQARYEASLLPRTAAAWVEPNDLAEFQWFALRSRTTLQLENDAMKAAKAHAARHRLTLGQAVSELVGQAADRPLVTEDRSGLRVLRLNQRSPRVTTETRRSTP